MRFPLAGKVVALGAVTLTLVWALDSVSHVVAERAGRLHEAQRSVADSLATSQSLLGPVLQRECTERWDTYQGEGKDRKTLTEQRDFTLRAVPKQLTAEGAAQIEPRYRGIFRVNGFALKANIAAHWSDLAALQPRRRHEGSRLSCTAPVLWVAVSDMRGIRSARVTLHERERDVLPGTGAAAIAHGFRATWPDGVALDGPVAATVTLELAGSESFAFAPIGAATTVRLTSDWPHPSFNGRFLPANRTVGASGFEADWRVTALASRAPQDLLEGAALCRPEGATWAGPGANANPTKCIESFGVSLIDPVSPYVLSDRATKYGLLFIALTFVAVALVEVMRRLRVHPVQYLLVGCALTLFFLLLVSLSEHVPFAWAYLAASGACTGLLTFYGTHVLRSARAGLVFGAGLALLYGALYVLLLREQTALVLGAALLFVVLGAVMVVTRKVDWYGLAAQLRAETAKGVQ